MTRTTRLALLATLALWATAGAVRADELSGTSRRMNRTFAGPAAGTSAGPAESLSLSVGEAAGVGFAGQDQEFFPGYPSVSNYPGTIANLTAQTGSASGQIVVAWTAPGSDGNLGTTTRYDVRVSSRPIPDQSTFASLAPYSQSWTPLAAGGPESHIVAGLNPGVTYYVAIEAFDATGVHGYLSNVPSAMPPSLLGTVSYAGNQGGPIAVGVFVSTDFYNPSAFFDSVSQPYPGAFALGDFPFNTPFYVAGYVDMNKNGRPDPGEHFAPFGGSLTPTPIAVAPGTIRTGVDFPITVGAIANQAVVQGTITYSGAVTGFLRVELHGEPFFQGTPIAVFRSTSSAGYWQASVPGNAGYFARAYVDRNADGVLQTTEPSGIYSQSGNSVDQVYVTAASSVTAVNITLFDAGHNGGQGTATVTPSTAPAGGGFNALFRVRTGADPVTSGGQVVLSPPAGWGQFQDVCSTCAGYVALSVQSTNTVTVLLSTMTGAAAAPATVTAGSLNPGDTVQFTVTNLAVPCASTASVFGVATSQGAGLAPKALVAGTPSVSVVAGAPVALGLLPALPTLVPTVLSDQIVLNTLDRCGSVAPVTASTSVTVTSQLYDFVSGTYSFDPATTFSTNTVLATTSPLSLAFRIGRSSSPFYSLTTSTPSKSFAFDFNLTGAADRFYAPVEVLAAAAISSAAVSTSAFSSAQSSVTFSPDGDGSQDVVYLSFALGSQNLPWIVGISSTPWGQPGAAALWTASGRGSVAPGKLAWDGRSNQGSSNGQVAAIGTYYIQIAAGGSSDTSLTAVVNTSEIFGQVTDAETLPVAAIPGAQVQVFGPVVSQTVADGNGRFVVSGLSTGTYTVTFSRSGYKPLAVAAAVAASTATEVDGPLQRASLLLITPTLQAGATQAYEQRGRIAVHTPAWDKAFFSPIHLPAASTVFDDGGQWDPVLQEFITRTRLRFEVDVGTYVVDATLPGYVSVSSTVYFGAVGLSLTLPAFVPNADVSGTVRLSTASTAAPNPNGLTVTVQAADALIATAAVGGIQSVVLPPGITSATWQLKGVPPGSYRVAAIAPGFASVSTGPVVVGTSDVAGVDLPAMTQGTLLVGTVTVLGDTRAFATLAGSSMTVSVDLNAWSPQTNAQGESLVYVASAAAQASAQYRMSGLLPGATYVVFARAANTGGPAYDPVDTMPLQVYLPPNAAQATLNLTVAPSSGTLTVSMLLPPSPAPDFTQVAVTGKVLASRDPFDTGSTFDFESSTALPNFSSATTTAFFGFTNLRSEVLQLSILYRLTGQSFTQTVEIVGGSTATVSADLTAGTYAASGRIIDQVSDPNFNTNAKIAANALYAALPGYPPGLSSTTARVEAVRRDFGAFTEALSTSDFDAETDRVGFISAAGTYSVSGLTPGVYLLRTLPLQAVATGAVLVPSQERLITITSGSLTGLDFTLSDGFTLTGNLILDQGIQDTVAFEVDLLTSRGDLVASTTTVLGSLGGGIAANSSPFSFTKVPAGGFYQLQVRDLSAPPRYIGQPLPFPNPTIAPNGLQGDRTGLDVILKRAAVVQGRLRDGSTGTLLTQANAALLPANFTIFALANPFLQGGYTVAPSSAAGRPIHADGTFVLQPLFPGVPYDLHLEQLGWDLGFLGAGAQNYAPTILAGVTLQPGQILDLGVVDLRQGNLLSGTITSTDGVKLPNVAVQAVPSFVESPVVVQTHTGADGGYKLWVSSAVSRYYDVTAAPRPTDATPAAYQQQTLRNVDLSHAATADFLLSGGAGVVTGRVVTEDSQPLDYPFGSQKGYPAAAVFLQPLGTLPETNLFGDIQAQTNPDGSFSVAGLSTGTYTLRAASLGYAFASTTVTLSGGSADVGTLTLVRGGTVSGDIAKQDPNSPTGFSCPNNKEVSGVAAADIGFNEFVVGTVQVDPQSLSVCHYTITGFKTGVNYQLALLGPSGDAVFPAEGAVAFAPQELNTTKTVNLTYRPSPVDCFATGKSLGNNQLELDFRCTKALRNLTGPDNDLSVILAPSSATSAGAALQFPDGTGALPLAQRVIDAGRKTLHAVYLPAVGEGQFSVSLNAVTAFVDPNTGIEYTLHKTFDFFTGVQGVKSQQGTNVSGINLALEAAADETERSGVVCGPGSFQGVNDSTATPSLNVSVGMQKAETRSQALIQAAKRHTSLTAAEESVFGNRRAVPAIIAQARDALAAGRFSLTPPGAVGTQTAKHPPAVDPMSAFYNLFLPAGIRDTLDQPCRLRLSYATNGSTVAANPTQLNVWHFNPITNSYELMDADKAIDTTNQTITVSVPHFSVYVVLASTPVAASTNPYTGGALEAFNFPNPFNLERKTKALNVNAGGGAFGTGATTVTTEGTIIRAGVPRGMSGEGRLRIFDVAGELVRDYDLGALTGNTGGGGTWYYFEWDGRNASGRKVASGLYVAELKVGNNRKAWKMVVIKDGRYQ